MTIPKTATYAKHSSVRLWYHIAILLPTPRARLVACWDHEHFVDEIVGSEALQPEYRRMRLRIVSTEPRSHEVRCYCHNQARHMPRQEHVTDQNS
jgi:hypothetical protein